MIDMYIYTRDVLEKNGHSRRISIMKTRLLFGQIANKVSITYKNIRNDILFFHDIVLIHEIMKLKNRSGYKSLFFFS